MANSQFTARYFDDERMELIDYKCDSSVDDILPSGFCIFHDENYLKEDKDNHKEHGVSYTLLYIIKAHVVCYQSMGIGGTIGAIVIGVIAFIIIAAIVVFLVTLFAPILIGLIILAIIIGVGYWIFGKRKTTI